MSRRWTVDDDMMLARHFGMGPDWVASHDLGFKGKNAGSNRVKILKETGVWDKLMNLIQAQTDLYGWHTLAFSRGEEARSIAFDALVDAHLPVPDWATEAA